MPNNSNHTYVADIRMMLGSLEKGIRPLAVYARRARSPLVDKLDSSHSSWCDPDQSKRKTPQPALSLAQQ
ncbi:MAG: hypothetical protein R3D00_07500 [Bacteroidia bacterium]